MQERHIEGFQLKVARQLVQQIEANVHAAFVCKTYFASHAWIKVGFSGPHVCPVLPFIRLSLPMSYPSLPLKLVQCGVSLLTLV